MITPLALLALALCGGVGAAARFWLDGAVRRRIHLSYPLATTIINVSGSLLLGLLTGLSAGAGLPNVWLLILGGGLLGGYTTFSTASVETVRLGQQRRYALAAANGLGMLIISISASLLGLLAGAHL